MADFNFKLIFEMPFMWRLWDGTGHDWLKGSVLIRLGGNNTKKLRKIWDNYKLRKVLPSTKFNEIKITVQDKSWVVPKITKTLMKYKISCFVWEKHPGSANNFGKEAKIRVFWVYLQL